MHVVIGLIIRERVGGRQEYLLVKTNKDQGEFTGLWYPPGGKIEAGESEEHALARELKEELNLDIKPIKKITKTSSDIPNQITHWWFCEASGDMKINNEEITEAGYFTLDEMKNMAIWPTTRRFFSEYIHSLV